MYYAEYFGTRLFAAATGQGLVSNLQFSQNFKGQVQFQVRDTDGTTIYDSMSAFTVSCGIVGVDGKPIGTAGGKALAEYTTSLTLGSDNKTWSGTMDCRTAAMATLIGSGDNRRSSFGIRFIANDGSGEFECSSDCTCLAQRIPASALAPASLGPVPFKVLAGQAQATFAYPNLPAGAYLDFINLSAVPVPDPVYTINVNPDNPALTTVTVTLAGNAVGDMNYATLWVGP